MGKAFHILSIVSQKWYVRSKISLTVRYLWIEANNCVKKSAATYYINGILLNLDRLDVDNSG